MSDILQLAEAINNLADTMRGLVKNPPTHKPAAPTAIPPDFTPPLPTQKVSAKYKCPVCNSQMVVRKRKTDGQEFYGCPHFPHCDGARSFEGKITSKTSLRDDDDVPF